MTALQYVRPKAEPVSATPIAVDAAKPGLGGRDRGPADGWTVTLLPDSPCRNLRVRSCLRSTLRPASSAGTNRKRRRGRHSSRPSLLASQFHCGMVPRRYWPAHPVCIAEPCRYRKETGWGCPYTRRLQKKRAKGIEPAHQGHGTVLLTARTVHEDPFQSIGRAAAEGGHQRLQPFA